MKKAKSCLPCRDGVCCGDVSEAMNQSSSLSDIFKALGTEASLIPVEPLPLQAGTVGLALQREGSTSLRLHSAEIAMPFPT